MVGVVKQAVRRTLTRFGYTVRSVGHDSTIGGVDLLHDVRTLLGGKSGATLFDVGANVGQTLDEFLGTFTDPQIYSFEPSPHTFEVLRARYGGKPGVRLENLALAEQEGTVPFHVTPDYSVNDSLLRPTWNVAATAVPVQVETVDGYCDRHGIAAIDLLKIDTQGNDLNVLRGAERMLGGGRVQLFSIEVLFTRMYEGQPDLVDIVSFAERTGYRLVGFYEQTYTGNRLWYLNACFVRAAPSNGGPPARPSTGR